MLRDPVAGEAELRKLGVGERVQPLGLAAARAALDASVEPRLIPSNTLSIQPWAVGVVMLMDAMGSPAGLVAGFPPLASRVGVQDGRVSRLAA